MRLKLIITIVAALIFSSFAAATDEISDLKGVWEGTLSFTPNSPKLPVKITFRFDDKWAGDFVFIGQGNERPQPLTDISIENDVISFAVAVQPKMEFAAKIADATMEGTMKATGLPVVGTLNMTRRDTADQTKTSSPPS